MNLVDYGVISNIWNELKNELTVLDNMIQYNEQHIKAADKLGSFLGSEPEDLKYFSPRSMDNVHKDEIEKIYRERQEYKEKNEDLIEKRRILSERISQLENVLSHHLTILKNQEEDRKRIARDLHDTSLQNLTHLIHKIELSSLYIDEDPIKAKLELSLVNKMLRETIDEIRSTIFNLRPMSFDDLGIKEEFERLILELKKDKRYHVVADIDEITCGNNIVLVSIYRIVQECINNITKHSEAKNIFFSCKYNEGTLNINIRDDGKGFDVNDQVQANHFGLFLTNERVSLLSGKMNIVSEIGKGTDIYVEIPMSMYDDFQK